MLGRGQRPGETFAEHLQRTTHLARRIFHSSGGVSLSTLILHNIHSSGAALAHRDSPIDSLRFWPGVMAWRDTCWWQTAQAVGLLEDPQNHTSWRHHRPGPHLDWERIFVKAYGLHWKGVVASEKDWKSTKGAFVDKAYQYLGVQSPEARYKSSSRAALACGQLPVQSPGPPYAKRRRVTVAEPILWEILAVDAQLLIDTDSLVVCKWVNGEWFPKYIPYNIRVCNALSLLQRLFASMRLTGPSCTPLMSCAKLIPGQMR